mgnify:FL=1
MEKKVKDISQFQSNSFDLSKTSQKINLSEVFKSSHSEDISTSKLFIALFNKIPNYFIEIDIRCKKANEWMLTHYEKEIKDVYYNKRYFNNHKNAQFEDLFYFLFDDLIIHIDINTSSIKFLFRETSILKVEKLVKELKLFKKKKKRKRFISLLVYTKNGIDLTSLKIPKFKLAIKDNYNDDFSSIHDIIYNRLSKKNDKGLVLLHGKPGTGKTSYIRYLVTKLKKNVIFLPPSMATALTKPELVPILIQNQNSVFVIEDAENIVLDRENNGNSSVSALLNISDGLLSDCLNIQIICSFNTDVSKIDNALLRKGRLIAKYDFKDLEIDKANKLSEKLGFDTIFSKPTPLSMIYNQSEKTFFKQSNLKAIGF